MSAPLKRCGGCNDEFPATLDFFYNNGKPRIDGTMGLRNLCKACHIRRATETRNKDLARARLNEWRANNPDKVQMQNRRANQKKSESGYHKAYYAKNRDRLNERRNIHLRESGKSLEYVHRRRFLNMNAPGDHSAGEWLEILDQHRGQCAECGATERIEKDHIIPLSRGGCNCAANLQPLCKSCNCSKGNKMPEDLVRTCDVCELPSK